MDGVLEEVKQKLVTRPDYITISGSGEPTLHSRLGQIIEHIQVMTRVPVAVLTNGSLLYQKQVREELKSADLVLPSLDAGDALLFSSVNRPHPEITFERLLSGLEAFRQEYSGHYWLEVLLLAGHTGLPEHVRKIAQRVLRIKPDKVQLNTAVRPPTESLAVPVPRHQLAKLARQFQPQAEIIPDLSKTGNSGYAEFCSDRVFELLKRRPCTQNDLAQGLKMRPAKIAKHLAVLETAGKVVSKRHGGLVYFRARSLSLPPSIALMQAPSRILVHPMRHHHRSSTRQMRSAMPKRK
jgi:wyosine [tRNA(Phe)-imidazoG37] synthetase (radical SAM superfamily)